MTTETPHSSPPPSHSSGLPRPYAGASAQDRHAERRERLLDAAFDVFGRQGYKETTLRQICANARMTDRFFYDHFKSLEDIFLQVRQRLTAEIVQIVSQALVRQDPDPVVMIRQALTAFFEYVKADRRRAQIILLDALSFGLSSTEAAKGRLDWYAGLIESRLKARYPHLPPHLDCRLVASGFLGHVTYISIVWTLQDFDKPVDELVDHAAYSWMGLRQWLSEAAQAGASEPTSE